MSIFRSKMRVWHSYTIVQVAFIQSYIHASTSILSCIHTFMRAPTYAQHQSTHDCISRPEFVPTMTLRLSPQSFQVASSNKRTTWNLPQCPPQHSCSSDVTNQVNFKSAIPSTAVQVMSHINFKSAILNVAVQAMPRTKFKSVIPSESGQEMSPINPISSGKFKQTNSLNHFKSVIPSESGQEASLIMFQVASSNKQTAWNLSKVSSPVWLVQRCHQSNGKVPVPTNEQLVSTSYQMTSCNKWTLHPTSSNKWTLHPTSSNKWTLHPTSSNKWTLHATSSNKWTLHSSSSNKWTSLILQVLTNEHLSFYKF